MPVRGRKSGSIVLGRHPAGRQRTAAARRGARASGGPRFADGPAEPAAPARPARADAPRVAARGRFARRPVDRPRRFQGDQRLVRPLGRRRRADRRSGRGCARCCARSTRSRGSAATSSSCSFRRREGGPTPGARPRRFWRPSKPRSSSTNHTLEISASIGIALSPEHGTDGAMLMRSADVAMYAGQALEQRVRRVLGDRGRVHAEPPRPSGGAAPRSPGRRVLSRLPARGRPADGTPRTRRGSGAVAPSGAGPRAAGRVHLRARSGSA